MVNRKSILRIVSVLLFHFPLSLIVTLLILLAAFKVCAFCSNVRVLYLECAVHDISSHSLHFLLVLISFFSSVEFLSIRY